MKRQPRSSDEDGDLPERIGRYCVEARLGAGGMGEVFLAWDDELKRQVAIKRIRQDIGLSSEQRERFHREAELAASVSHSSVVQIYDLLCGGLAIVMEYIEGRTLAARLAASRPETAEVLRLALEIAQGLAAAHEKRLVHRDLKAANIMITDAGHAKILDFGVARPMDRAPGDPEDTRPGVVHGTCHAMSPEQVRGEEVDERSDLFSLGSLVHEMLTGRPPFRGTDPFDSMRRVVAEAPVDPLLARPDLPAAAADLLRSLLEKNRDDRPSSAHEVIAILASLQIVPSGARSVAPDESVSEFPTEAPTVLDLPRRLGQDAAPGPTGKKPSIWTRRRILLVGVAVLLVLAGLLALFLIVRGRLFPPMSQEDQATLKEIEQRLDDGETPPVQDWPKMEAILQRNPRSVDAHVVASRVEHALYQSWREPDFLYRALALAQRARALAPNDPRPLVQELKITLTARNVQRAETLLHEIEAAWPLHPEILPQRALLEEQKGHWKTAVRLLNQAVAEDPSWQNRYRLASLEAEHGRIEAARRQIGIILDQEPGNLLAKERLGHLELVYGDADRAEQIYTELLGVEPRRVLNMLGQVHLFAKHYQEAATLLRGALDAAPDQAPTLVTLADAEVELGQPLAAGGHYRRALELLDRQALQSPGLTPGEQILRAQCLARLGEAGPAMQVARAALSRNADDPELLQQSALVHSLAGDQETARENAQAAIDRGLREWWFSTSAFLELRKQLDQRR